MTGSVTGRGNWTYVASWDLGSGFLNEVWDAFSSRTLEKRATLYPGAPSRPVPGHFRPRRLSALMFAVDLNKEPDNPALRASLALRVAQAAEEAGALWTAARLGQPRSYHVRRAGLQPGLLIPEAWEVVLNYLGIELERKRQ